MVMSIVMVAADTIYFLKLAGDEYIFSNTDLTCKFHTEIMLGGWLLRSMYLLFLNPDIVVLFTFIMRPS